MITALDEILYENSAGASKDTRHRIGQATPSFASDSKMARAPAASLTMLKISVSKDCQKITVLNDALSLRC